MKYKKKYFQCKKKYIELKQFGGYPTTQELVDELNTKLTEIKNNRQPIIDEINGYTKTLSSLQICKSEMKQEQQHICNVDIKSNSSSADRHGNQDYIDVLITQITELQKFNYELLTKDDNYNIERFLEKIHDPPKTSDQSSGIVNEYDDTVHQFSTSMSREQLTTLWDTMRRDNATTFSLDCISYSSDESYVNGVSYVDKFTLEFALVELLDTGYNIRGKIKTSKCSNIHNISKHIVCDRIFNFQETIRLQEIFIEFKFPDGNKKLYDNYMSRLVNNYLDEKQYTALRYRKSSQIGMIYIKDTRVIREINTQYKLHISCKLNKWKVCYDKLLDYLHKNPGHVPKFKMPFLSLKHVHQYDNEDYCKYIKWDGGTAAANFVLYFNKCDAKITQHDHVIGFLTEFIPYWKKDNFDFEVKRDQNNLSFNERLTDSIYITYSDDTCSKQVYYLKKQINQISDADKQFKMSDELIKEKDSICKQPNKHYYDDCLLKKYNFNTIELCGDTISRPDAWVSTTDTPTSIDNENSESHPVLFYPRCYHQVPDSQ